MKISTLLLALFFTLNHLYSQTNEDKFYKKIMQADSVVIVSHLLEPIIDEKTEEVIGVEELVIKNKPNNRIISNHIF